MQLVYKGDGKLSSLTLKISNIPDTGQGTKSYFEVLFADIVIQSYRWFSSH